MELSVNISSDDSFNCNIKLFDRKIDLCHFGDSKSMNPFISAFMKAIESSSDLRLHVQ